MNWNYHLEEVAYALSLKRSGSEYKGPCPVCGGKDRFWIARGKQHDILATCRQGCSFADIARAMIDRGLASREEYAAPRYNREATVKAHTLTLMIESAISRNGLVAVSPADIKALQSLAKSSEPSIAHEARQLVKRIASLRGEIIA